MEDPDYSRDTRGSFYKHGVKLIPAWISNYIHYKMSVELVIQSQFSTVALYISLSVRFVIHARFELFNISKKNIY